MVKEYIELGTFRVSDWEELTVFQNNDDSYTVINSNVWRRFSKEQIEEMRTKILSEFLVSGREEFTTKELQTAFRNASKTTVYYSLVVLTVIGFLKHSWGRWTVNRKV